MGINLFEGLGFDFEKEAFSKLKDSEKERFREFLAAFENIFSEACAESPELLKDVPDDFTKLRFLEADNFKVELASKRLLECLQWRLEYQVSNMLEEGPPAKFETYRNERILRHVGYDKLDQPIMAERFGETMSAKNTNIMSIEEWIRCIVYDTELLCRILNETSKKCGRPIQRVLNIYDAKGISVTESVRNVSFLKQIDRALSSNYPELVSAILVINAPSFISGLYNNIVKRFLDPVTVAKVRIHSNIPDGLLAEFADVQQLPEEYGGLNTFGSEYPHRKSIQ